MNGKGVLYFLTNKSMPGLVKIGYTTCELDERLQQLNKTGTPTPFEVSALFYVRDASYCEKEVHNQLGAYRINPKREFFKNSVTQLIHESIENIEKYIDSSFSIKNEKPEIFRPDEDDIYFMFYLLHDCYEQNIPYSTAELAEHHSAYAPLELEVKLINLQNHGYIKRVNREHEGLGKWQLLPKGVKFMFDENHHAQDLIDEAKRHSDQTDQSR